jgi:hypothetical protein
MMPQKTNQLPKKGTTQAAPSPLHRLLPFFVIGAAVLLLGVGIVLIRRANEPTSNSDIPTLATDMPRLAVDQKLVDFGKVPLDIPVKATFKLTNVGDQPLQILNQPVVEVKQGC